MSITDVPHGHHNPFDDPKPKTNKAFWGAIIVALAVHAALIVYLYKTKFEPEYREYSDDVTDVAIVKPAPPPPPPPPPKKVTPARAKANLASLFSDEDYPASAVRAGESGATSFRLEVGPNGRVSSCTVTSSSGSSALDSTTCRLLRSRARFTPATDNTGANTSDAVTGRIVWRLPAE
jgi:TonB family protein